MAGLICIGWSSFAHLGAADARQRLGAKSTRGEVWVVGSSSVNQAFGRLIARELRGRGYRVRRQGVTSAGLARPDFRDMRRIVEELPISKQTRAVFIYLGINDAQALWLYPWERTEARRKYLPWRDARWSSLYVRRARGFLERICRRGARRAVVILPVDVRRSRLQKRLKRIRALQAQAASTSSCGVALATGGDEGRYVVDGTALRLRDGFHLSRAGARVVWERIRAKALRVVENRAPVPPMLPLVPAQPGPGKLHMLDAE
jgi:hypothetical protein